MTAADRRPLPIGDVFPALAADLAHRSVLYHRTGDTTMTDKRDQIIDLAWVEQLEADWNRERDGRLEAVHEVETLRAKLLVFQSRLPLLREHLPAPLFSELAAVLYLSPDRTPTEAEEHRARQIAAGLDAAS